MRDVQLTLESLVRPVTDATGEIPHVALGPLPSPVTLTREDADALAGRVKLLFERADRLADRPAPAGPSSEPNPAAEHLRSLSRELGSLAASMADTVAGDPDALGLLGRAAAALHEGAHGLESDDLWNEQFEAALKADGVPEEKILEARRWANYVLSK